jgi:hypothetical protein
LYGVDLLNSLVSGLPAGNPVLFDVRWLYRFSFNVNIFVKLLNHILNKAYMLGALDTYVKGISRQKSMNTNC